MSLSEILHKNSPTGINRKASESDYEKLVDRNTELFDELKEKEEEIEKLKEENNLLKQIIGNDKKYSYGIRMVSDEK